MIFSQTMNAESKKKQNREGKYVNQYNCSAEWIRNIHIHMHIYFPIVKAQAFGNNIHFSFRGTHGNVDVGLFPAKYKPCKILRY